MRIIVLKGGPFNNASQILEEGSSHVIVKNNKQYEYKETDKKDVLNRPIFELVEEKDA